MSYQKQSFGMMDSAYFVPKTQILAWINDLLKLNITKIQVLGAGSIYCQIVDVIHPGKIALNKVNWKAKNDYQFINNLKILQTAFDKCGIKKHVEVERLAKAKYQDNLEFIQWLKRYYEVNCGDRGNGYDAEQKRNEAEINFGFAEKNVVPKTYNGGGQVVPKESKKQAKTNIHRANSPKVVKTSEKDIKSPRIPPPKKQISKQKVQGKVEIKAKVPKQQNKAQKKGSNENEILKTQLNELQMKIEMLKQIVIGTQDSEMKLTMIQNILQIQQKHKKQEIQKNGQKMGLNQSQQVQINNEHNEDQKDQINLNQQDQNNHSSQEEVL